MQEPIENAMSKILWKAYETSLPDTPYRMALVLVQKLREQGYLKEQE
jgi:hypothetical protein